VKFINKYLAEFVSTFFLVLIGTGSIVLDQNTSGAIGILGIALAFGGIIALMILLFGHFSGAHMNPAVTIALAINKAIGWSLVLPYIISQVLGAIAASICLKLVVPENNHLGMTLPQVDVASAFLIEFSMTFLLMSIILSTAFIGEKNRIKLSALLIGLGIVPLILYSGPLTGGSFNPARSIGPAFIVGNLQNLWIYIVACTLGAMAAVILFKNFNPIKKSLPKN